MTQSLAGWNWSLSAYFLILNIITETSRRLRRHTWYPLSQTMMSDCFCDPSWEASIDPWLLLGLRLLTLYWHVTMFRLRVWQLTAEQGGDWLGQAGSTHCPHQARPSRALLQCYLLLSLLAPSSHRSHHCLGNSPAARIFRQTLSCVMCLRGARMIDYSSIIA